MSYQSEILQQIIRLSPHMAELMSLVPEEWIREEEIHSKANLLAEGKQIGKSYFFGMLLDLERRGLVEHKIPPNTRYRLWRAKPLIP